MKYSIFENTMADMTWKELEEKAAAKAPVLFPIGVIEEHGPHLPLGADIYWAYAVCRRVQSVLAKQGIGALIAPPYYWGINHCTGAFPGCFSLRPETMKQVLLDIFANLSRFGFQKVYCANYHGDPVHNQTILSAAQDANRLSGVHVRIFMEPYETGEYGLTGTEDFLLLDEAEYPPELFDMGSAAEQGLLDIHAGAFETAVMEHLYPGSADVALAKKLPSYSLNEQSFADWCVGDAIARKTVPLGYAGNPAGYVQALPHVEPMLQILAHSYASKIAELHQASR